MKNARDDPIEHTPDYFITDNDGFPHHLIAALAMILKRIYHTQMFLLSISYFCHYPLLFVNDHTGLLGESTR